MSEKTRDVAIVCRILWTGGVALVAIEQQRAMLENGFDSDLLFLRNAGTFYELPNRTIILNEQYQYQNKVKQILSAFTKKFAGHRGDGATVDLDYILESRKVLTHYDKIVFHDQWSAILGVYYRIKGIKYIVVLHEFFRVPPGMKKYSPFAILAWIYDFFTILLAPAVVTISDYNFQIINKFKKKTYLIRNGFPEPLRKEFNVSKFKDERKIALSLSLWDIGRNPDFYAKLAHSLPSLDFIMAGSWTIKEEELKFIERTKSIKNLKVTGSLNENEKRDLLASAHFYIRLGYNERGPGMGALEAMSFGLIPFANEGIGLSELIEDGVNGYLLQEPLLESSISAIDKASKLSLEELASMVERNFRLCDLYSWKNNAKDLNDVFDKVL